MLFIIEITPQKITSDCCYKTPNKNIYSTVLNMFTNNKLINEIQITLKSA